MRVRETILHSERHPDGAATLQGRQHRSWPQANPNRSNQGQPSHPGYPGRQGIPGFGSLLQWQEAVTTRGGVRKGFALCFREGNPFKPVSLSSSPFPYPKGTPLSFEKERGKENSQICCYCVATSKLSRHAYFSFSHLIHPPGGSPLLQYFTPLKRAGS